MAFFSINFSSIRVSGKLAVKSKYYETDFSVVEGSTRFPKALRCGRSHGDSDHDGTFHPDFRDGYFVGRARVRRRRGLVVQGAKKRDYRPPQLSDDERRKSLQLI